MLSRESEFYEVTLYAAIIIVLFVLYVYFKDRNKRL